MYYLRILFIYGNLRNYCLSANNNSILRKFDLYSRRKVNLSGFNFLSPDFLGAVGGAIGIILLLVVIYYCYCRKKENTEEKNPEIKIPQEIEKKEDIQEGEKDSKVEINNKSKQIFQNKANSIENENSLKKKEEQELDNSNRILLEKTFNSKIKEESEKLDINGIDEKQNNKKINLKEIPESDFHEIVMNGNYEVKGTIQNIKSDSSQLTHNMKSKIKFNNDLNYFSNQNRESLTKSIPDEEDSYNKNENGVHKNFPNMNKSNINKKNEHVIDLFDDEPVYSGPEVDENISKNNAINKEKVPAIENNNIINQEIMKNKMSNDQVGLKQVEIDIKNSIIKPEIVQEEMNEKRFSIQSGLNQEDNKNNNRDNNKKTSVRTISNQVEINDNVQSVKNFSNNEDKRSSVHSKLKPKQQVEIFDELFEVIDDQDYIKNRKSKH